MTLEAFGMRRSAIFLSLWLASCVERTDAEAPRVSVLSPKPLPSVAAAVVAVEVTAPVSSVAAPAAKPEDTPAELVLAAGGDVNLGRECGQEIIKDPGYDPFGGLGAAWRDADARFVNLESQLSDQHGLTQSPEHRLIFTGPPGGAETLARAGVSLVSTANNHAWDFGKGAMLETIANLQRAGVSFAGTGHDLAEAYRPAVVRIKGMSVALFAVTQIWNQGPIEGHEGKDYVAWASLSALRSGIERARQEHDFVLLSYHGGAEYCAAPSNPTREFVDAVMSLGVDAFIGHHPHVLQGIGWAAGKPVLYSLGNFVFAGHDDRPWTKTSYFARLVLRKGEKPELSACPVAIDGHRPRALDPRSEALRVERLRLHLIDVSTSTGGARVWKADEHGCLPVREPLPRQPLSSSN